MFTSPKDIQSLEADALDAAIQEANDAFVELAKIDDADLTDEQVSEMSEIHDFVQAAKAEGAAREAAAQERADKIAALRNGMTEAPDEDEEVAPGEEAPAEEETPEAIPAEEEEEEAPAVAPKQAASAKTVASRAARKAPKAAEAFSAKSLGSLVAAADVGGGIPSGHVFSDLHDATRAIKSKLSALPRGFQKDTRIQTNALSINLPANTFNQEDYIGRELEMLMAASKESRLDGGSLVAAGGWGAPSETVLDFCKLETTDGLLDLPEVTLTRGGIQYTKGPSFASVRDSATGFWDMTEAIAEAGTELKTSLRPEVPGFTDRRLDAVGVMIEAGLLLRQGWPEVIDRTTELSLIVHQHKLARKKLLEIQGYTGAAVAMTNGFGNALDVLHILELIATGERERNAMALDATLEVLLPHWIKAVIRADLANRNGLSDSLSVTDEQINAHFSARKLKVQWLYGYQDLTIGAGGVATFYPETVEAIMYPAGTFVAGVSDVITLDTVYDSVNLKKNDYVHLFVEQGLTVTNPCYDGRRVSFPLNANGRTGAADITGNLFRAPAI